MVVPNCARVGECQIYVDGHPKGWPSSFLRSVAHLAKIYLRVPSSVDEALMPEPLPILNYAKPAHAFRWKRWLPCGLLLVLHAGSLCTFTRIYFSACVAELSDGKGVLYWGGDREMRNNFIYNAGEWPLAAGNGFAGREYDGSLLQYYGPKEVLSSEWNDGLAVCERCGIELPRLNWPDPDDRRCAARDRSLSPFYGCGPHWRG